MTETVTAQLIPAPRGTTPNMLIAYGPGSVVAPQSLPAFQNGVKNTIQDTRQHQVPR